MRARTVLAVFAAILVPRPPADALVFCKGRGATVLAREKCKRREQQIDATTIGGLMGAPGTPGPGLHVVDKNGNEVGVVVSGGEFEGPYFDVVRQIDGAFFVLTVSGSGFGVFQPENDGLTLQVFYADSACTTPPMVFTPPGPLTSLARLVVTSADGRTGYYGLVDEQRTLLAAYWVSVESGADDSSARFNCMARSGQIVKDSHDCTENGIVQKCVWCCEPAGEGTYSPAHTLDLTALGLTPPFTLKRQ